jgi:hypothetical protein
MPVDAERFQYVVGAQSSDPSLGPRISGYVLPRISDRAAIGEAGKCVLDRAKMRNVSCLAI